MHLDHIYSLIPMRRDKVVRGPSALQFRSRPCDNDRNVTRPERTKENVLSRPNDRSHSVLLSQATHGAGVVCRLVSRTGPQIQYTSNFCEHGLDLSSGHSRNRAPGMFWLRFGFSKYIRRYVIRTHLSTTTRAHHCRSDIQLLHTLGTELKCACHASERI